MESGKWEEKTDRKIGTVNHIHSPLSALHSPLSILQLAEIHEFRENFNEVRDQKLEMFRNRLAKVFRHRSKIARKTGVGCFRIYDHDLPEFPFCIDQYETHLYVSEYKRRHGMDDEAHDRWLVHCLEVVTEVTAVPPDHIHSKMRQRKTGRQGQYQKLDEVRHEFIVQEGGLNFLVNLTDYLDTGLFLDHRITREWVRANAKDKVVMNLFAYTGSFSVYAAAGGAAAVHTVDLSNTYLQWAERNLQTNGFDDKERYLFIQADVKQYLHGLPPASFDLIIMDPPTFSNSKRMDDFLDVQRDHVALITAAMATLKPGGQLIFSTNYRRFELDKAAMAKWNVKDITRATTPFDFEGTFSRFCYLVSPTPAHPEGQSH